MTLQNKERPSPDTSGRFWSTVYKRILPSDIQKMDSLSYWRYHILSTLILAGVVLGFFVLVVVAFMAIEHKLWGLLILDGLFWLIGIFLLVLPRINFMIKAGFSVFIVYAVGLIIIYFVGPLSGGPAWLFCFSVLTGILMGPRAAVLALAINAVTISIIGFLMINNIWGEAFPFFDSPKLMVSAGINFLFLNALAAISVSVLLKGLTLSHEKEKHLAESLKHEQIKLTSEMKDREQAEISLHDSEERYRNILESIEDGYYEVDLRGNYTFFNDSMCRILGYSRQELMGKNNREYMDRENAKKIFKTFNKVFETGFPTKSLDWQLIRKDGSTCFVETAVSLIKDVRGKGLGFRGIARDVSHRRRLEKQLQQAHKMESIGRLAGGIAHDFNNLLYIITGNTDLAISQIRDDNTVSLYLGRIRSACRRAADVVRQLLNFSKETEQALEPIDIVDAVRSEILFLKSMIPVTIDIRQNLPEAPISIPADLAQIKQVLINLFTNASQALEKTGGAIEIHVERVTLDKKDPVKYPDLVPGAYVRLLVKDTGPGIEPGNLDKIFDPYFTTREVGKGSGMGLSVVHGIVKRHSGSITVTSRPGKGAEFSLFFPVINGMIPAGPSTLETEIS